MTAQIVGGGDGIKVPSEIRELLQSVGDLVGSVQTDEGKALSAEVLRTLLQVPHVVGAVGKGGEIFPDAKGIANSIVKGYKSRRTLVLEYEEDVLGENGKVRVGVRSEAMILTSCQRARGGVGGRVDMRGQYH